MNDYCKQVLTKLGFTPVFIKAESSLYAYRTDNFKHSIAYQHNIEKFTFIGLEFNFTGSPKKPGKPDEPIYTIYEIKLTAPEFEILVKALVTNYK